MIAWSCNKHSKAVRQYKTSDMFRIRLEYENYSYSIANLMLATQLKPIIDINMLCFI